MNKTNIDVDGENNGMDIYKEKVFNFLNGLSAYFAIVLTSTSLLILFVITLGFDVPDINQGLNLFLSISAILLIIYGVVTTRTQNTAFFYRLLQVIKRIADIVFSSTLLFFVAPLFIPLAAAVKIESSGPVLYRSIRIGQFGKPFGVIKFRTMYTAPKKGITRAGRFLRRFSLDQIPILTNVLIGELSLVGPRPRSPERFAAAIDDERKVIMVKPGVTGLWQVSGASEERELELDRQYIENWSLGLDIKIFFKTVLIVLLKS